MNLMLHAHLANAGSEKSVPLKVADALAADPGERFDVVLANPPFGANLKRAQALRQAVRARAVCAAA